METPQGSVPTSLRLLQTPITVTVTSDWVVTESGGSHNPLLRFSTLLEKLIDFRKILYLPTGFSYRMQLRNIQLEECMGRGMGGKGHRKQCFRILSRWATPPACHCVHQPGNCSQIYLFKHCYLRIFMEVTLHTPDWVSHWSLVTECNFIPSLLTGGAGSFNPPIPWLVLLVASLILKLSQGPPRTTLFA